MNAIFCSHLKKSCDSSQRPWMAEAADCRPCPSCPVGLRLRPPWPPSLPKGPVPKRPPDGGTHTPGAQVPVWTLEPSRPCCLLDCVIICPVVSKVDPVALAPRWSIIFMVERLRLRTQRCPHGGCGLGRGCQDIQVTGVEGFLLSYTCADLMGVGVGAVWEGQEGERGETEREGGKEGDLPLG